MKPRKRSERYCLHFAIGRSLVSKSTGYYLDSVNCSPISLCKPSGAGSSRRSPNHRHAVRITVAKPSSWPLSVLRRRTRVGWFCIFAGEACLLMPMLAKCLRADDPTLTDSRSRRLGDVMSVQMPAVCHGPAAVKVSWQISSQFDTRERQVRV